MPSGRRLSRRWLAGMLVFVMVIVALCVHGVFASPSQVAPLTIQEALAAGQVEAYGEALGMGFKEPMVRLVVVNKGSGQLELTVPWGTRLEAPSAQYSELVVAEAASLTVSQQGQTPLTAYATQFGPSLPSAMARGQRYTVGQQADGELLDWLTRLQAHHVGFASQLALWVWSTNLPLEDIISALNYPVSDQDRTLAMQILGIPAPATATSPSTVPSVSTPVPEATPAPPGAGETLAPAQTSEPDIVTGEGAGSASPPAVQPTPSPRDPRTTQLLILGGVAFVIVVGVVIAVVAVVGKQGTAGKGYAKGGIPPVMPPQSSATGASPHAASRSPAKPERPLDRAQTPQEGGRQVQRPQSRPAGSAVVNRQSAVQLPEAERTRQTPVHADEPQAALSGIELVGVDGALSGDRFTLRERSVLSRSEVNWIVIPDNKVSAPHAALDYKGTNNEIKDLNSKNGVRLNDDRVGENQKFVSLPQGVQIGLGSGIYEIVGDELCAKNSDRGVVQGLSLGLWVISRERLHVLQVFKDGAISDIHALFTAQPLGVNVKDLNSSRGTRVDGERVISESWATAGSLIEVGGSALRVEVQFGRYRLVEIAREGGMARVYRGWDYLNREVALKTPLNAQNEGDFRDRFTRERDILSGLRHKHIVEVYETGEISATPFVAMQYINGGTLLDRLADGPLPIGEAVRIAREVGEALAYAHGAGLAYHRDVKPSNILLDNEGAAYLSDFGIARRAGDRPMTAMGQAMGTKQYTSPEQAAGLQLDHRTDIYSLGVVLYQMLAGSVPFDDTSRTIAQRKASEPPPDLCGINPSVSPELNDVVLRCLAPLADDRYQSAAELVAALAAVNGS